MPDIGDYYQINTGLYAQLPQDYKNMLTNIKYLILHDVDPSSSWFPSGDPDKMDAYAWFLETTMQDINIFLRTQYTAVNGAPDIWDFVLQLGTTINAINARVGEFVEVENMGLTGVPYADPRDFVDRWKNRVAEIRPIYEASKKNLRLSHLPKPSLTVSHNHFMGFHATPLLFQGLPSWFSAGFR